LLEGKVELVEGGVAIERINRGRSRLGEDERFSHRLLARSKISQQGIASAGAFRPVVGHEM
jgi:hypothetical protein